MGEARERGMEYFVATATRIRSRVVGREEWDVRDEVGRVRRVGGREREWVERNMLGRPEERIEIGI